MVGDWPTRWNASDFRLQSAKVPADARPSRQKRPLERRPSSGAPVDRRSRKFRRLERIDRFFETTHSACPYSSSNADQSITHTGAGRGQPESRKCNSPLSFPCRARTTTPSLREDDDGGNDESKQASKQAFSKQGACLCCMTGATTATLQNWTRTLIKCPRTARFVGGRLLDTRSEPPACLPCLPA